MKFTSTVFAPLPVSYGPVSTHGPCKTLESALIWARRESRKQSLINGLSYAVVRQFVPSANNYQETATLYADHGEITSETIHEFPML